MVAPSRFCHVVYRSHQFEEMVAWYIKVFEAKVQHKDKRIAFLTYDDEHHRFAIANIGPAPDGRSNQRSREGAGVVHLAYAWKNLDELIHTYERLKGYGITPVRPIRHGMTLSMYYDDPDGNNLEFQVDLLEAEAANAYMRTAAFAENPSGELFDPDELVSRYVSGKPLDDLIFRSDQPERLGSSFVRDPSRSPPKRSAAG